MTTRILKTVTFAVLAAWSVLALAEAPSRVGRISMAQGQVTIAGELGDETSNAVVNWPVTSRNQITTGRNARTEIRIGSTAVRLDADTALDVTELDDDNLRLHLHYGSASVRVRNPDLVRGFEMSTPQGIVRLQDASRFRIDSGRRQDSTMVTVFDGTAVVDGGGSRLTVRAGKRAEFSQDDVRTGLASRDSFDDWAMLRDERDDRSASVRYVTSEMTGYEELDQNGTWVEDQEYGPLWSPRRVPANWAPYRDGQWTYLQPWGWTWVDNAPWGYAPFHYGRWVMVNQRWCWAPGRNISRVVWSPALVGWVGGSGWSVGFSHRGSHRPAPATGWFPLGPRDVYSPTYRMNHDNLRYVNRHSGGAVPDIRGRNGRGRDHGDNRRHGLTVVPHEQFSGRGNVPVKGSMQAIINNAVLQAAPAAVAPPTPAVAMRDRNNDGRQPVRRVDLNGDGRPDNRDGERMGRFERGAVPATPGGSGIATVPATPGVSSATPRQSPVVGANQPPSPAILRREGRFGNEDLRRDSRIQVDDARQMPRMERPTHMPTPAPALPAALNTPPARVITLPSQPMAAPVPAPAAAPMAVQQPRDDRFRGERPRDPDPERERRPRGMESYQQQQVQMPRPAPIQAQAQFQQQVQQQVQQQPQQRMSPPPAPMAQPMAQPQPQPQRMSPPPAPIAQQAPQPQPQRSEAAREERKRAREEDRR